MGHRADRGEPTPRPESAGIGVVPGVIVVVVSIVGGLYAPAALVAFRPRDWKGCPEHRSRATRKLQAE